jgi:ribosome-binding factor A
VSRRLYKVNEAVREVVSQAIDTEVKDPRLGFVTVTGVETTSDLRDARVYVSVLGDEAQRADSLVALQAAHGVLQRAVAARLRMKRTPRLVFAYDETTDRALHINQLLATEAAEIAARAGDAGTEEESSAVPPEPECGQDQGAEGQA